MQLIAMLKIVANCIFTVGLYGTVIEADISGQNFMLMSVFSKLIFITLQSYLRLSLRRNLYSVKFLFPKAVL